MLNERKCNRRANWLLSGALISLAPLSAQSLTWGNSSNSAITPQMVVGDYWTLSISGAAPNASVILGFTKDGGPVTYYTLGYTDPNTGNYYSSQQVTDASLGTYQNWWFVGGVQLGPEYDYEVIRLPDQLYSSPSSQHPVSCPGPFP